MKKLFLLTGTIAIVAGLSLTSCKKTIENHQIAAAYVPPVNGITSTTLGVKGTPNGPKAYAGTLLANTTYTVVGDIEVEIGDTLFVQPGVTVCVEDTSCIIIKGALVSIGTSTNPIVFTDCEVTPNNSLSLNETTDPAWNIGTGWWSGIQCDTSATLCLLKWTQIWFTGAPFHRTEPIANSTGSKNSYGIYFQRTTGHFIMEDCKMYGTVDDAVRIEEGQFEVSRCVFEKTGWDGGDGVNVKSGGVGDFDYNLCVGSATNSSKASDKGGNPVQCNMCMYNNTYIDNGWRNQSAGVGSNIDYEQGAEGCAYNNLIVNCRIGFRIVASPAADTFSTALQYSNNFIYGDSVSVTSQFYPNPGDVTKLGAYVSPIPAETGYVYNPTGSTAYNAGDAATLCGENNPMFLNFPLPLSTPNTFSQTDNCEPTLVEPPIYSPVSGPGYNFRLQSTSPCVGAGTTNFLAGYPLNVCASVVISSHGFSFSPNESAPCSDIGCYPYVNTSIGNQQ